MRAQQRSDQAGIVQLLSSRVGAITSRLWFGGRHRRRHA